MGHAAATALAARAAGSDRIGRHRTRRYDAIVEVERSADHVLGEEARQGFITGLLEGEHFTG